MSFEEKLKEVNSRLISIDEESFDKFVELFSKENLKNERFNYYQELKKEHNFETLAEAKHFVIKKIFSNYIQEQLLLANSLSTSNIDTEIQQAVCIVDKLDKIRQVFKSHDVVDYKQFILNSEPNINELEINFLFSNVKLNDSEIEDITEAIIKAFGKNHKINSESDFQIKMFAHPLIGCLDAYSDLKTFQKHIDNNVIELGYYKDLVSIVLKAKEQLNAEAYQGFITFLIKEDITKGFSNIIKLQDYEPKYLQKILLNISKGEKLRNDEVEKLIQDIKDNHTVNLRIEKNLLKSANSSNQSLNDYGFPITENGLSIFFHGHATENHGEKQAQQQVNTSLNLDISKTYAHNIGLTVTKYSVLKRDHHSTFLKQNDLDLNLNVSKSEEILFSNLLIDSGSFSRLATDIERYANEGLNIIKQLSNSFILSTNHLIVKEDIATSQKIILSNIGKNDFELMLEKKNAYINLFSKNKEFIHNILEQGSTNNYLSYELISKPIMDFLFNALDIENNSKIQLFNKEEIILINDFVTKQYRNNDLAEKARIIRKQLTFRNEATLEKQDMEQYQYLTAIIENETPQKINKQVDIVKNHTKFINTKNRNIPEILSYLEENPIDNKYSIQYKTGVSIALKRKILEQIDTLDYVSIKKTNLKQGVEHICSQLSSGKNILFCKSDFKTNKFGIESKTLAYLFKQDKKDINNIQKENEILLGILKIADISKGKIFSNSMEELSIKLKI